MLQHVRYNGMEWEIQYYRMKDTVLQSEGYNVAEQWIYYTAMLQHGGYNVLEWLIQSYKTMNKILQGNIQYIRLISQTLNTGVSIFILAVYILNLIKLNRKKTFFLWIEPIVLMLMIDAIGSIHKAKTSE